MTAGRKQSPPSSAGWEDALVLSAVRVTSVDGPRRELGRRDTEFAYRRLVIPSLILDYTFLLLRQAGVSGDERFLAWAGSLAGADAFVSTVLLPRARSGYLHGEIDADVVSRLFSALDQRDLVPLAQIHSHPHSANISTTDRERPLVAQAGFLSIIVPDFAFIPAEEVTRWGVYEYRDKRQWRTLPDTEKRDRLIVDDSIIRVD